MRSVLLAIALLFLPTGIRAEDTIKDGFITAATLFKTCDTTGSEREVAQMYCLGYVGGVVNMMQQARELADGLGSNEVRLLAACPNEDKKVQGLVEIVRAYLRKHPEMQSDTASKAIIYAMQEAYPCQQITWLRADEMLAERIASTLPSRRGDVDQGHQAWVSSHCYSGDFSCFAASAGRC